MNAGLPKAIGSAFMSELFIVYNVSIETSMAFKTCKYSSKFHKFLHFEKAIFRSYLGILTK